MARQDKVVEKERVVKYHEFYLKQFNIDEISNPQINLKSVIKLIANQYDKMSDKQRELERIFLEEKIRNEKDNKKLQYNFYNLCLEILNRCYIEKLSENTQKDNGFIVELFNGIFGVLEKISIFNVVRQLKSDMSYRFVDLWIVGNMIGAIISTGIAYNLSMNNKIIIYSILLYSVLRVFEVIIYQINVLLFHPYRAQKTGQNYKIKSVTRMVVSLLSNYVEIMFWYSTMVILFIILNGDNPNKLGLIEIIRSNILCIITLDSNIVKEILNSNYSHLSELLFLEVISGMIMTVISLSRFIGILPNVDSNEI
ncbi:MAG: hypothetical protein E6Y39_10605 [Clostridium butyricum]|nr:hypothetical protein [Clostridium butyricum]